MKKILIENIVKRIKTKIISEGALDKPILDLSRIIVSMFNTKKEGEFEYEIKRRGEDLLLNIIVELEKIENHNEPFEIYADAGFDELYFNITYDPQAFPSSMNDLVAEIKETVTHELEHIIQQNFEEDYINPYENDYGNKKKGEKFNYFVKKIEIPAFVKGLIKRANTKKMTLDSAMDEWYSENYRNFKNTSEWKEVKQIWMNWAKENLLKQKVKKFK